MGLAAVTVAGYCGRARHLLACTALLCDANRLGVVVCAAVMNQGRQRSLPESMPSCIRCATASLCWWTSLRATCLERDDFAAQTECLFSAPKVRPIPA